MNRVLKYPGSKWRIAKWIIDDWLRGWHKEYTTCYSQVCSKKQEVIWMNYEPVKQMELELEK